MCLDLHLVEELTGRDHLDCAREMTGLCSQDKGNDDILNRLGEHNTIYGKFIKKEIWQTVSIRIFRKN